MKAKLLIALLAAASLFTACSKDQKEDEDVIFCCYIPDNIFMGAFKADSSWYTEKVSLSVIKDSLVVFANRNNESLKLSIKYVDTGRYAVTPKNVVFRKVKGTDTLISEYRPALGSSNYIQIDYYDTRRHLMQGGFKIDLIKEARFTDTTLTDTIRFLRGAFRVSIPK